MTALDAAIDLEDLIANQKRAHGVHALVLYGSRARGDATAESDVDVAGFADVAEPARDARLWSGLFLDAFVYPTARAEAPDVELLKLCGGRVLLDERGVARELLERVAALELRGPAPLSEGEQRMRRVWAKKMLARIRRGDVEGHYRRHWLLYQLLEDHFALPRRVVPRFEGGARGTPPRRARHLRCVRARARAGRAGRRARGPGRRRRRLKVVGRRSC